MFALGSGGWLGRRCSRGLVRFWGVGGGDEGWWIVVVLRVGMGRRVVRSWKKMKERVVVAVTLSEREGEKKSRWRKDRRRRYARGGED